jgi:hypothetical protein
MSFENSDRIFAIDPVKAPDLFKVFNEMFGEDFDGIETIGAFWDDEAKTRKRAADMNTCRPIPLSDGRAAFICLWQTDLCAYFDKNGFVGVEELTLEQLNEAALKIENPQLGG